MEFCFTINCLFIIRGERYDEILNAKVYTDVRYYLRSSDRVKIFFRDFYDY